MKYALQNCSPAEFRKKLTLNISRSCQITQLLWLNPDDFYFFFNCFKFMIPGIKLYFLFHAIGCAIYGWKCDDVVQQTNGVRSLNLIF